MQPTATVLIGDDHPIVLAGLVALLQGSAHSVVARCTSGSEVLEALQRVEPDILLLDVNMPPPGGLEIARALKELGHSTKVVLVTSEIHDSEIVETVRLGLAGIILKESAPQQLITCLDTVCAGRQWFDPALAKRVIHKTSAITP